jgi:signal transduction histidine kinase
VPIKIAAGDVVGLVGIGIDITDRKRTESYREMRREIIQLLSEPGDLPDVMQRVISALKTQTGFDAVGLRLQDGEDFPYYSQDGFSQKFLLTENTLLERGADGEIYRDTEGNVCLECTCGLVISGKTDRASPHFTKGGSFWTNNSVPFLDLLPAQNPGRHPRNTCIHDGYASVALIPVRDKERIIGLINLNDRRKDCFTLENVELLENIAAYIGESLMRRKAEKMLHDIAESKARFASTVAHELRSPLAMIKEATNLVVDEVLGPLNDGQKEMLNITKNNIARLGRLINNVLVFQKMDAQKMEYDLQEHDVNELVKEAHINAALYAGERKEDVMMDLGTDLPRIKFDTDKIMQVLINLLANAIKYSESGPVVVQTRVENSEIQISVQDSGQGIYPEELNEIFKPFVQAKGKKKGGTGLGLAITKEIVLAHHGRIWVESEVGKGSTFHFTLPVT